MQSFEKAIGKMQDISAGGEGQFVSHNMAAVKQLCTRGIVLENGWWNLREILRKH
jgi:lipopolysaccharide transport system ATP-binding protein